MLITAAGGCAHAPSSSAPTQDAPSIRIEQLEGRVRRLESAVRNEEVQDDRPADSEARIVDLRPWQEGAELSRTGSD